MTVYFLNPSNSAVAFGGVQKLYDWAAVLDGAGIDAAVVESRNFSPGWFQTTARRVRDPLSVGPGDLLAVSEVYGDRAPLLAPGVPWVSLNQNPFDTFRWVGDWRAHPYTASESLVGAATVSEYSQRLLEQLCPGAGVARITLGVDPELFAFVPGPRPRRIVYLARKRQEQAKYVLASLAASGALDGWEVEAVGASSHTAVAQAMGRAQVFLSFGWREGFGLPVLEAMARGCTVIGFSGVGGRELFKHENAISVPEDDLVEFISVARSRLGGDVWDEGTALATSQAVLGEYQPGVERAGVLSFFGEALRRAEQLPGAEAVIKPADVAVPQVRSLRHLRKLMRMLNPSGLKHH